MYKLLRFIYTNYRLKPSVDEYTRYRWENKYLYYSEVYNAYKFKKGYFYLWGINIYSDIYYFHLYNSLRYIYVTACVENRVDLIKDLKEYYNEPEDEEFINFVNKIVTKVIKDKEKIRDDWNRFVNEFKVKSYIN